MEKDRCCDQTLQPQGRAESDGAGQLARKASRYHFDSKKDMASEGERERADEEKPAPDLGKALAMLPERDAIKCGKKRKNRY